MSSMSVSLLQRLRKAPDAAAWSQFVRLYVPLLHAWARRKGLSEGDADELLQDVFATLHRGLPALADQPDTSFRGWLRAVLLNSWRTLQRRRPAPLLAETLDAPPTPDDPLPPGESEERRQIVG